MAIGLYHANGTIRLYARPYHKASKRTNGARTVARTATPHVARAQDARKPASILSRVVRAIRKAIGGGR